MCLTVLPGSICSLWLDSALKKNKKTTRLGAYSQRSRASGAWPRLCWNHKAPYRLVAITSRSRAMTHTQQLCPVRKKKGVISPTPSPKRRIAPSGWGLLFLQWAKTGGKKTSGECAFAVPSSQAAEHWPPGSQTFSRDSKHPGDFYGLVLFVWVSAVQAPQDTTRVVLIFYSICYCS